MSDERQEFELRCTRLRDRHHAQARERRPGVSVTFPRGHLRFRVALRSFMLLMACILAFKGVLLASLGATTYGHRLEALAGGTILEKAGALVMGMDPVTRAVADLLHGLT